MSETGNLLDLWRSVAPYSSGSILATVVRVDGSSYRKPGARMLIAADGRRAGTISGGCLESEVARKAAWHAGSGPTVQQYSTFFDEESGIPYGLGCGGTVHVLFEQCAASEAVLQAMNHGVDHRLATVAVAIISSEHESLRVGTHLVLHQDGNCAYRSASSDHLAEISSVAKQAFTERGSRIHSVEHEGKRLEVYAEYIAPPTGIFIFGAGDDAQPLVDFAAALGWRVTVADGRAQLAKRDRFARAASVIVFSRENPLADVQIKRGDAAVVMTHSYEQDRALLRHLLGSDLAYLGVLGPRKRTLRLVNELAESLGMTSAECMERLRSPVGLDIGAYEPAGIALSIAAEIHATLQARDAAPLSCRALDDSDGQSVVNMCPSNA
jgi:xanthine dehydrogenase accessory factor